MSSASWRSIIGLEATRLGPSLYAAMSVALVASENRARGLLHSKYPHLRPLLVRSELREYLESELLPSGWQVGGNPGLMGQVLLKNPELAVTLRILKERRKAYPQGVPPAGRNPARRREWQAPLPAMEAAVNTEVELLLLWDYAKGGDETSFTLRIVHTTEAGIYGKAVECDLDLEVVAGGTIFETLSFQGDDDDEDFFFQVEIDKAENDQ